MRKLSSILLIFLLSYIGFAAEKIPVAFYSGRLRQIQAADEIYATGLRGDTGDYLLDDSAVADNYVLSYDSASGKLIFVAAGSGDVSGPASATDNAIARFDGAGGKTLQNSGVIIDDSDNVTGIDAITANEYRVEGSTNKINLYDNGLGLIGASGIYARVNSATALYINDAGEITQPLQPCFQAIPASAQNDIAKDTWVTIVFGTEVFDVGNNFASNTFTAPVTGKYLMTVGLQSSDLDTGASYYRVLIQTSNRHYDFLLDTSKFSADVAYYPIHLTAVADMDANDTSYISWTQTGGTVQTDVGTWSYFCGSLIN